MLAKKAVIINVIYSRMCISRLLKTNVYILCGKAERKRNRNSIWRMYIYCEGSVLRDEHVSTYLCCCCVVNSCGCCVVLMCAGLRLFILGTNACHSIHEHAIFAPQTAPIRTIYTQKPHISTWCMFFLLFYIDDLVVQSYFQILECARQRENESGVLLR